MIDKKSDRAIYLQIADKIKGQIESNLLIKDEIIDSENKLAEIYKVSRVTARRAVDHLVNLGYLYRIRGKGTFVLERREVKFSPQKLYGFTEEMNALNIKTVNKVIEFQIMKADKEISEKLNIDEEDMIYHIKRLRCAEDDPIILEESYLPVSIFPELNISILTGSKYEYVEKFTSKKITESYQEFGACLSDEALSKNLDIEKGSALLTIKNQSFLEGNIAFEYSIAYYKESKHKIIQRAKRD